MNDGSKVQDEILRKWIYEEIVDRIPPFKWRPPIFDVVAQLLLVETVGVLALVYLQMPIEAVIFCSLASFYTVIWSALIGKELSSTSGRNQGNIYSREAAAASAFFWVMI